MSRRLPLLGFTLLASSLIGACVGSSPDYPPLPPDPPRELGDSGAALGLAVPPSTTLSYELVVGGTVPIAPGQKVGYALTASALKSYQLRWTGDARSQELGYTHFYGAVWTAGHFTSFVPGPAGNPCQCVLETNDEVKAPVAAPGGGERINWSTNATTGWDGFEFSVDVEPIYLDVFADNFRRPNITDFAAAPDGAPTSPAESPFGMSSALGSGPPADSGAPDAISDSSAAD